MTLLDTMGDRTGLYIGGDWRPASDGAVISVQDPATEQVIATVASATADDAVAAVAAAADAAAAWADEAPRTRSIVLRRAFELMMEREQQFAELITIENGKALSDAVGEVRYGAEFLRWFSEEAVRTRGEMYRAPAGDKRIHVIHQPIGVSVLVTPWNFPLAMATRKIGPALAAGCTVVLKPASDTPLTALATAALFEEAGCPPGVVNVIPSDRSSEVVNAALMDRRVRKLSFTGSTHVGKILLAEASRRVINTSMELGGNAPFLVLGDADVPAAVEGALVAKMRNAGEACTAANRFYVHGSVADEFGRQLADRMRRMTVGHGLTPGVEVGPLINASSRDGVAELVAASVDGNARVLTGGSIPDQKGYFYTPTVLGDVAPDDAILEEEIFGPVAPIVPFDDLDDAIGMANNTEMGLIAYVYGGDQARAMAVAEALEAGMVAVNRGLLSDPAAPFGGIKQSGIGREGGFHGIYEYLEAKYIGTSW